MLCKQKETDENDIDHRQSWFLREVKADGSELTPRELSDIKEAEAKAKREANPEAQRTAGFLPTLQLKWAINGHQTSFVSICVFFLLERFI